MILCPHHEPEGKCILCRWTRKNNVQRPMQEVDDCEGEQVRTLEKLVAEAAGSQ